MYALKSVKKFIKDNKKRLGKKCVQEMLERAAKAADNGLVTGSSIEEIMQNNSLANEFHEIAMTNPEHFEINILALQTSGEQ